MRVDRGGTKGIKSDATPSSKESVIQKKGQKVTVKAGPQDRIRISQTQNTLNLHVNEDKPVSLNPEQSRNLKITGQLENVSVDSSVTLPIHTLTDKTPENVQGKVDGSAAAERKQESSLTAQVTMKFLASELKDLPKGPAPRSPELSELKERNPLSDPQLDPKMPISPEFAVPSSAIAPEKENSRAPIERQPIASGLKEETSLTATMKMKFLSSELLDSQPSAEQRKADISNSPDIQDIKSNTFPPELKAEIGPQPLIAAPDSTNPDLGPLMPKQQLQLLADSPEKLLSMKPEDKAVLMEKLSNENHFSAFEERGIHSLLASAASPEQFQSILPDEIGLKLSKNFENPEMKNSWDKLVSAYDLPGLMLNPEQVSKIPGLLLENPEALADLHLGCEPMPLTELPHPMKLEQHLHFLDRPAFTALVMENKIRDVEHRPLVDAFGLRKNLLEMIQDPDVSLPQKIQNLQSLRTDEGLSEFQMREIGVRPLVNLFETAFTELLTERKSFFESFESNLKDAIASFGPESVAVEIVKGEHEELLQGIEPQIVRLGEWKTFANEIFSGPSNPLIKIDRVLDKLIDSFVAPAQQLVTEVNRMLPGLSNLQTGRLETVLNKAVLLDIPELKIMIQPALPFVSSITNGSYPALFAQILSKLDPVRDRDFLLPCRNSSEFFHQVIDGTLTTQLQHLIPLVEGATISPQMRSVLPKINEWRSESGATLTGEQQNQLLDSGKELVSQVSSFIQQSFPEIKSAAVNLTKDRRFIDSTESVKTGTDLMIAYRNGNFVQILAALNNRMAGSPAVQQIIDQALHLTNSGTAFFRGLLNRDWARPVFGALKKNPGSKELQEVAGVFSDALNLFLPLTSVEHASPFLQYQRQLGYLKDEERMHNLIQQYQSAL